MELTKITGIRYVHYEISLEDIKEKFGFEGNVTVSVQVPGGGDYSNCPIVLGEDFPKIRVMIEEKL